MGATRAAFATGEKTCGIGARTSATDVKTGGIGGKIGGTPAADG
jgi:hypothetical protein